MPEVDNEIVEFCYNNYENMRKEIQIKFEELNEKLKYIIQKDYLKIDAKFLIFSFLLSIFENTFFFVSITESDSTFAISFTIANI